MKIGIRSSLFIMEKKLAQVNSQRNSDLNGAPYVKVFFNYSHLFVSRYETLLQIRFQIISFVFFFFDIFTELVVFIRIYLSSYSSTSDVLFTLPRDILFEIEVFELI